MKATGNILKWSMNFLRMERSFLWRRASSQPGKKRLQDRWRAKGLRWQRSIHGEEMMLGVNLA
jgi:hypothetical protein